MKTALCVAVNNGSPEEYTRVVGTLKEGQRIVEATERGVRALELEVQDVVLVKPMAEEDSVDLEKLVNGFGLVNKEGESVYC